MRLIFLFLLFFALGPISWILTNWFRPLFWRAWPGWYGTVVWGTSLDTGVRNIFLAVPNESIEPFWGLTVFSDDCWWMDALVSGRFLRVGLLLSLALLLSPYLYKFFAFVGSLVLSLRLDKSAIHVISKDWKTILKHSRFVAFWIPRLVFIYFLISISPWPTGTMVSLYAGFSTPSFTLGFIIVCYFHLPFLCFFEFIYTYLVSLFIP